MSLQFITAAVARVKTLSMATILCFFAVYGHAQQDVAEDAEAAEKKKQKSEDRKRFNEAIGREFTKVVAGDRLPGNYASFDVAEGELNGAGSSQISDSGILSFTLKAGVSEGLSSLFTDSRVNPNVAFGLNYSFLSPFRKSVIVKNADLSRVLELQLQQIEEDYQRKVVDLAFNADYYRSLQHIIGDSLRQLERDVKTAREGIASAQSDESGDVSELKKRLAELTKLLGARSKLTVLADSLEILIKAPATKRTLLNEKIRKRRALEQKTGTLGARFSWFTIGYKLDNKRFFLYDSTSSKAFNEQLVREEFTSHQLSVSYNYFSSSVHGYGVLYGAVGVSFLLGDNQLLLDKTKVTDKRTVNMGATERTEEKGYTAFRGDYTKDIRSLRPYVDLFYFPTSSRTIALHAFPEVLFQKDAKPLTNLGLGLFFTFSDAKDKEGKATINAELYVQLNDLNNNLDRKRYAFHERNDIGVRVAFPLNFNTEKKPKQ
jgi:hypothetical protein